VNRICPELSDVTRTTSERRETRQTWTLTEVGSEGRSPKNFRRRKLRKMNQKGIGNMSGLIDHRDKSSPDVALAAGFTAVLDL